VTPDQANSAIRKYYQTDKLTFVVLGAADKIRDQVKKYDPQMTEVSIKTAGWGDH
jgi:predicted Zn-dependent peptidase